MSLLLSLAAGFFLNEEASLKRLCKSLSYQHEGWLVLYTRLGVALFTAAVFVSFLKGHVFALLFWSDMTLQSLLPVYMYLLGNILAVRHVGGIFYTPWLALAGLVLSRSSMVIQFSLAIAVALVMLTRNLSLSLFAARVALCLALFFLLDWAECFYCLFLIITACVFSLRQSPTTRFLIRYVGKIFRWRVTI